MGADEAAERRAALVARLERDGALADPAVRAALLAVPRHRFLPHEPLERAYADNAIATKFAGGVAISSASQPAIVAQMLQQLAVAPGMRVLEIGAGTGYNAALLRTLVGDTGRVTTVDLDGDLTATARGHLAAIGITDVEIITGDGARGWPVSAPYDRIILTVGAGDIAPAWAAQLTEGGLLVLPLTIGAAQFSIAFVKHGDTLQSRSLVPCGFMPLRGSMAQGDSGGTSVSPAADLLLTLTNAVRPRAGAIAALMQTPPTPSPPARENPVPPIPTGWWSAMAFALAGAGGDFFAAGVTSHDARYGFTGSGFGIFDAAVTGGCLIRFEVAPDGPSRVSTLRYGNARAADWLAATIADWEARGAPQPSEYHITAFPLPADVPVSAGAFAVDLPHWRLVVTRG